MPWFRVASLLRAARHECLLDSRAPREFGIDEDALAIGAGMMAWGAITELKR